MVLGLKIIPAREITSSPPATPIRTSLPPLARQSSPSCAVDEAFTKSMTALTGPPVASNTSAVTFLPEPSTASVAPISSAAARLSALMSTETMLS